MAQTLKKLIEERRQEYKKLLPVFCPALNADVAFSAAGFHHLRFDGNGKERPPKEQFRKLNLLPSAELTIQAAVQHEYRKVNKFHYWASEADYYETRGKIRVIVRKSDQGKLHFWSIMDSKI